MPKLVILLALLVQCVLSDQNRIERILVDYPTKKTDNVDAFLQHFNSNNQVAVLIDDSSDNNLQAYQFIRNVSGKINFSFARFNTVGAFSTLQKVPNDQLKEFLLNNATNQSKYLGSKEQNGTLIFFAISNAIPSLPDKSGILIFTNRKVGDFDLLQHVRTGIRKKGIRVYIVWGGLMPSIHEDEKTLKEFCEYTGGLFLVNANRNLSELNYNFFLHKQNTRPNNVSLLLSKHNLLGEKILSFPVDSDVTGIHINVSPAVTSALITSPRDVDLDLLDDGKITKFSTGSFVRTSAFVREIHLTTTTADVGFWRLRINARARYNCTVFVYTKLTAQIYLDTNGSKATATKLKKHFKLGINGDVSELNNISYIGEDGKLIANKFRLDWEDVKANKSNFALNQGPPEEAFYAVIHGKDHFGHDFERLSYVRQGVLNDKVFPHPPLTIEVGAGSELITTPGRLTQIFFDVRNNGNTAISVRFQVKDEQSFLYSMSPYYKVLSPEESVNVRVTLNIRENAGSRDNIVFSAIGGFETVEKRVIVDVGTGETRYNDRKNPYLHHTFTSDCTDTILKECEEGTWSVEIRAKDSDSGLLQVTSNPAGIYFPSGFTSGTNEEVTGYYFNTCCNSEVQIIAVDRANNRSIKNLNAYNAFWSPGAIAALVLGILIIILIIVLAVCLIRRCLKKKDVYNLPVYGSKRF